MVRRYYDRRMRGERFRQGKWSFSRPPWEEILLNVSLLNRVYMCGTVVLLDMTLWRLEREFKIHRTNVYNIIIVSAAGRTEGDNFFHLLSIIYPLRVFSFFLLQIVDFQRNGSMFRFFRVLQQLVHCCRSAMLYMPTCRVDDVVPLCINAGTRLHPQFNVWSYNNTVLFFHFFVKGFVTNTPFFLLAL